jgi:hypothetical protein
VVCLWERSRGESGEPELAGVLGHEIGHRCTRQASEFAVHGKGCSRPREIPSKRGETVEILCSPLVNRL